MKIRSFELNNFRKFRSPIRLDGFTDGLNIVIEPNETGKSTLLDAMRAALFERHTAKNELTRSYCPWGDEVAPMVSMSFDLDDCKWQIDKQFLKGAYARLSGGGARMEGEAAEERLQTLLGFERGSNRGSDIDTRGALGLLWVEQCGGLDLAGPGRVARDTITSVLEHEVGAITGGRRFAAVSASVEKALSELRTSTGRSRGPLAAAEVALAEATARRKAAEATLRDFEDALAKLEGASSALRRLEADINDPDRATEHARMLIDLETAERAQQRLKTLEAQREGATAKRRMLEASAKAHADAKAEVDAAAKALDQARAAVIEHDLLLKESTATETAARRVWEEAQRATAEFEQQAVKARSAVDARQRSEAIRRAFLRLDEAIAVEGQLAAIAKPEADALTAEIVADIVAWEAEQSRCQAVVDAGAVVVDFMALPGGESRLTVDGRQLAGRADIRRQTDIAIEAVGTLRITPPGRSAGSAEAALATANQKLAAALLKNAVTNAAEARVKLDQQAKNVAEAKRLFQRLVDICPADDALGIDAGIAALRAALQNEKRDTRSEAAGTAPSAAEDVERQLTEQRVLESRLASAHAVALAALQKNEVEQAKLASQEEGSALRLSRAQASLTALEAAGTNGGGEQLTEAIQVEARVSDEAETASKAAAAFDIEALRRRLAAAEQRARNESTERLRLSGLVGGLEATVKSEGGKGPAGLLEEAREEEAKAEATHHRVAREAEVLAILSRVLNETAAAAARQFVEPVTRRAATYVQRLLPGASIGLSEEMAVSGLVRHGQSEVGPALSRGTQEQLAILTRLAFADLLIERQRPVSVVLDDALVYSDDDRLEVMTDILTEASKRMQIILLTCRAKAFRHVSATRLTLA